MSCRVGGTFGEMGARCFGKFEVRSRRAGQSASGAENFRRERSEGIDVALGPISESLEVDPWLSTSYHRVFSLF